jgi:hypothetical protein
MNFETFRNSAGEIKLYEAFEEYYNYPPSQEGIDFANAVTMIRPIKSRQMAALMLILMRDKS